MKAIYFVGVMSLLTCNNSKTSGYINNFDISPDDRNILISYYENDIASLYVTDIDGKHSLRIIKSDNGKMYTNPRYSPDGKSILFIRYLNNKFEKSTLCVSKVDGTEVKELTNGNDIVTEAVFSKNGKDILYCLAKEYGSHSPIGKANAHNFDIYSINIFTKQVKKLSNLDAYGIGNISEIDTTYVLFHLGAGEDGGIYSFEKTNPSKLRKIYPANFSREPHLLGHPEYYGEGLLLFTAPYELYSMNLKNKEAILIYDSKSDSQIQILRFFKTKPRVLFKRQFDNSTLVSISIDGSNAKMITVDIED